MHSLTISRALFLPHPYPAVMQIVCHLSQCQHLLGLLPALSQTTVPVRRRCWFHSRSRSMRSVPSDPPNLDLDGAELYHGMWVRSADNTRWPRCNHLAVCRVPAGRPAGASAIAIPGCSLWTAGNSETWSIAGMGFHLHLLSLLEAASGILPV